MILGYLDSRQNLYRVEQATNGACVIVRVNVGGNRKRFRELGEYDGAAEAQRDLAAYAEKNGWKPYASSGI